MIKIFKAELKRIDISISGRDQIQPETIERYKTELDLISNLVTRFQYKGFIKHPEAEYLKALSTRIRKKLQSKK